MNILALETSGKSGSLAALVDGRVLCERGLTDRQRTAQSLTPALVACLADVEWRAANVDLVVVTTGPGSFTGLRVGVTTAKIFAYTAGCEVLGIDTLRVAASQAAAADANICAVIDAQRQQVFAGWFRPTGDGRVRTVRPTSLFGRADWLAELAPPTVVTGSGLAAAGGELLRRLPAGVTASEPSSWAIRAASAGRLGWLDYQDGRRDDVWTLLPNYFRKSAAEEKWDGLER